MSYYRLYPSKNNTIFRYYGVDKNLNFANYTSKDINCGANSIMELMDGKGESKLMFAFDFPVFLRQKLNQYSYTANLQLWDAGTLYEPAIKLKNVKLQSFTDDFSEGDGYSFQSPENKKGVSNWEYRDSINKWQDVTFSNVTSYHLNTVNEDLNFDVSTVIAAAITNNNNPRFSLSVDNRENDPTNIFRKFICSNYTRTVFKPYIEFFIEDTIIDKTYNFYAQEVNRIYLLNQRGNDFTDTLTASVSIDGTINEVTATKERDGVYYIEITPSTLPSISAKSLCQIIWKIGGVSQQKQMIEIKNPNELNERFDHDQLFFYAITNSTHNITRHGDVLPFTVISEIRGKGKVILDNFEYRITSMDGFEMIPWTGCSVYRDKIYFNIMTDYFFPENQYEVFVRYKTDDVALTSTFTHKFKVAMSDKSNLRELNASPYYSREQFLGK